MKELAPDVNSQEHWENILEKKRMPAELSFESTKAKRAGIDLVSLDLVDSEAEAFAEKLRQEGPNNVPMGFPESMGEVISEIESLKEALIAQHIPEQEIHLTIHTSCVNDQDCIILFHNNGNKYHFNTKDIKGYTREKMVESLASHNIACCEK